MGYIIALLGLFLSWELAFFAVVTEPDRKTSMFDDGSFPRDVTHALLGNPGLRPSRLSASSLGHNSGMIAFFGVFNTYGSQNEFIEVLLKL